MFKKFRHRVQNIAFIVRAVLVMHHDHRTLVVRRHRRHFRIVLQSPNIIDHIHALTQRPIRRFRLERVNRCRHRRACQHRREKRL